MSELEPIGKIIQRMRWEGKLLALRPDTTRQSATPIARVRDSGYFHMNSILITGEVAHTVGLVRAQWQRILMKEDFLAVFFKGRPLLCSKPNYREDRSYLQAQPATIQ